jgi:hypothetical protein
MLSEKAAYVQPMTHIYFPEYFLNSLFWACFHLIDLNLAF